ncbi:MAG: crossover junction endodeoxyribonuclease RuvC [bacterium]
MRKSGEGKIILGIDPGFAITGYGIIEVAGKSDIKMIDYGCITTESKYEFPERLEILHNELEAVIKKYDPSLIAVEELFFCKNVKTALMVGHARGVILLGAIQNKIPLAELTPLQVKQGITGYGKADKRQMQKMVKIILGLKEIPSPDDAADALAIAITAANNNYPQINKSIHKFTNP